MIRPRRPYSPEERVYADAWLGRAGHGGWLSYHLHPRAPSQFGRSLLRAVQDIDRALPNVGLRYVTQVAAVRYVAAARNPVAWRAGFEQLLQLFAEILVIRALCNAP